MITYLKMCKPGSQERDRFLSMNINALAGYLLVESAILIGNISGVLRIDYFNLLILSVMVDVATIVLIIILCNKSDLKAHSAKIIFFIMFLIYIILLALCIFWLEQSRFATLIYALLAITIELPFNTKAENGILALGSVLCYTIMSYYSIEIAGQPGPFVQEILYSTFFFPPFIVLAYVSRQINRQKMNIETGKDNLQQVNEKLVNANNILRRARNLTDNDMTLAAHVQHAFLPETPQDLSDWDAAAYFRPYSNVSGDCYDFYTRDKSLRGVSIFDVSGHGLSSGLLTMIVKPFTTRHFNQMGKHSLGRILSKVNESIVNEFSVLENYITGVILRLEGETAEYVNAGHPDIIIKRKTEGKTSLIQDEDTGIKGQPIGLSRSYPYRSIKFDVKSGDFILLYTDCLIETTDSKSNSFGHTRLIETLNSAPDSSAGDVLDYVMYGFFSDVKVEDVEDDLTVIVLKKR